MFSVHLRHIKLNNSGTIYGIRCISTDEIYLDFSVDDIVDHEWVHFDALRNGAHQCKKLLKAWGKYGEDDFLFVKIESSVVLTDIGARIDYWAGRYTGKLLNSNLGPTPKRTASAKLLVLNNAEHPEPYDIRAAREAAGLTMQAAGRLIHIGGRMWGKYETGAAPMHKAYWELFIIKSNQVLSHWDTPDTDK